MTEEAKRKHDAGRQSEDKLQRDINSKRKKAEVYHTLGEIFLVWGIFGYVYYVLKQFETKGIIVLFFVDIDTLLPFVFNIFLWAGLVLLWRADKNENQDKKSKWLKFLKIYILISLIIIGVTFAIQIVMRIAG